MVSNEDAAEVLIVSEENKEKGKYVRSIISRITDKKHLTDDELFKLCDTLNDKSLTELFLLEKLYK